MSKMPAKKKSCFQITSVTQAQVAANSATDDTESLDDPDESRTEDVSSEIFDVSRTDCEPEVCDRSSSEETLNNVSESEGQLPAVAPLNGGFGPRNALSVGHQSAGNVQASGAQQAGTMATSQVTNSSSATTIASCSSRFRVIKLDHGSGEPFRRGRWTCTEYYEKDQEGSAMTRTVDGIRHTNMTEPGADRDSGLGTTVGSLTAQVGVSGQGPDTSHDSSFTGPLHTLEQPHSFSMAPQQVASGSGPPDSFSNKPVPVSVQQQVSGSSHTTVPPPGHDGVHQGAHIHKSPSMPPPVQPMLYQTQPVTHHLQSQAALTDYGQQHMPITVTQTHPGASLSVVHGINQGSSPVPTQASGGVLVQGVEMSGIPEGVPLGSQLLSPVPSLVQHPGVGLLSNVTPLAPGTSILQQPVAQYQVSGALHGLSAAPQSTQNMPSVSIAIGSVPASSVPIPGGATIPNLNTSAHSQADESRRMSDAASALIPAVHNKDMVKPLISEGLQLPNPAVSSLFGISIPIDGEDDSASGVSVVAIDNKIEQAMDLVKSHLMYAVREEVEVLKEQIKELIERNSVLEQENAVLKSLANSEQLSQLSVQSSSNPSSAPSQLGPSMAQPPQPQQPPQPYLQLDASMTMDSLPRQQQPNVTSA
ncbi:TSC22 domain family protein 2-like isoform X2 [Myxocyprinus asiaticus]|uniref:TSC22 domain family protein 2-like isoform X2 n=1 Tax=Myxocyprinus asiaticus TaxID=70543 RepID=UPI002221BACF|nr:TSC22 domain family protein 2-like isoform X2 [Myxocyprinus asiaticus]